jgi:hypothetical protein
LRSSRGPSLRLTLDQTRFEIHEHALITRRAILEELPHLFRTRDAYRWRTFIPTDLRQAREAELADGSPLCAGM